MQNLGRVSPCGPAIWPRGSGNYTEQIVKIYSPAEQIFSSAPTDGVNSSTCIAICNLARPRERARIQAQDSQETFGVRMVERSLGFHGAVGREERMRDVGGGHEADRGFPGNDAGL